MPHRTGLSHAMLAVVLTVLWVFFERSLSALVRDEHFVFVVEFLAARIQEVLGLSVAYSTLVTMLTIALMTVLAFAWGYAFHLRKFGRNT